MKGVGLALVVITLATTPAFQHGAAIANDALSRQEAEAALCQPRFHWDCNWVVDRAWRESSWKPGAVNRDCSNDGTYRYRCYGFLQLEESWAPNGNVDALLDLWTNIEIAYRVWATSGQGNWP